MDTRDLVDINEAQRITGLDKDAIYKLARQKRIRSFKVIGSALRFERSDLVSLVEERPAHV
jgi:excisionase family DNA binding protein